jgi:biopolymer transport protein ExbB/TolQ
VPEYSHAMNSARGAADRAAAILHRKFVRGTSGLQAIARIAPVLGIFGTGTALIEALRNYNDPSFSSCCCASGLSEALVPIAISLVVAVTARGGLRCVRHEVETFDLQMHTTTLELLNHLARPHLS